MIAVTATEPPLFAMSRPLAPDKQRVARNFRKGRSTYDRQALIQHKTGVRLLGMLAAHPHAYYPNVLEIGCGTGLLTENLLKRVVVGQLFLNDLVPEFHADVESRLNNRPHNRKRRCHIVPFFGDIETLPLPPGLDLVISGSTFQWLSDLGGMLKKISAVLEPSGGLAFSTFGPGTLAEFRQLTGIGLEYEQIETIRALLEPYFNIIKVETTTERLMFSSPREVLRHLQDTGVCGVGGRYWTPQRLRRFEAEYIERFGTAAGVPLSYVATCFLASKKNSNYASCLESPHP